MKIFRQLVFIVCCSIAADSIAQQTNDEHTAIIQAKTKNNSCCEAGNCCDGNLTPAGIMTDHIHKKGEWMVSYTYMNMAMKGNKKGTDKVSDDSLYTTYMMAPQTMKMEMHMLMVMYGVTDRLTLMAMGGYNVYHMGMNMPAMIMSGVSMPALTMYSSSADFADTKIYGLYNFSGKENQRLIGSIGISLPTGTIRARGVTMVGANERLPYSMQSGTGSVSILPDVTFTHQFNKILVGANAGADLKINNNNAGYKFGNEYHANVWTSYKLLPFISGSLRAEWVATEKITGTDPEISSAIKEMSDPSNITGNYGGTKCSAYAGLNAHFKKYFLKKLQFQIEYGVPFFENLNGPQMSLHANMLAGVQYSF